MSRSHVLLLCPNARLVAAQEEAWEGKDPGSIRVLLANPPLGEILAVLGAIRSRKDGTDNRAACMDGWEAEEEDTRRAD